MKNLARLRLLVVSAAVLALTATANPVTAIAAGSGISAIVNGTVITSGDVAKRENFLKLRHVPGNLKKKAQEEMVDETLMRDEIIRVGTSVSTDDVNAAFARFAGNNHMDPGKLTAILQQAGIGPEHFKAYIGIQMSWPRTVQARYGGGKQMSNQDLVVRMQQDNGKKPVTNEYILQQMIFVVPESKRKQILGKRKAEAEASRKTYPGCEQAKAFAATMHDVSVREIGRVMEPQLPEAWKADIIKAQVGGTTPSQATDRGVEYISICKKRQVSDDVAAEIVYQNQDLEKAEKAGDDPNSKKYLAELHKTAQIELH
jgi:peptidyl-prolyl cis-trans isomerase SurA